MRSNDRALSMLEQAIERRIAQVRGVVDDACFIQGADELNARRRESPATSVPAGLTSAWLTAKGASGSASVGGFGASSGGGRARIPTGVAGAGRPSQAHHAQAAREPS